MTAPLFQHKQVLMKSKQKQSYMVRWCEPTGDESWMSWVYVDKKGIIYFPMIFDDESERCGWDSFDEVSVFTDGKHVYVPIWWLLRQNVKRNELLDGLRVVERKVRADIAQFLAKE
jgi:hypothetical protein